MSVLDIFCTLTGVFLKGDFRCFSLRILVFFGFFSGFALRFLLLKEALEVFSAPTAARACSKALAQLTGPSWFFNSDKVDHFSASDVKTKAYRIVRFHELLPCCVCLERKILNRKRSRKCTFCSFGLLMLEFTSNHRNSLRKTGFYQNVRVRANISLV